MMGSPDELAVVSGEPLSFHRARVLTAWLSDDEAATALLGHSPRAGDDLSGPRRRLAEARAAVSARTPFEPGGALVVPQDRSTLDVLGERSDIRAAFAALEWHVEAIDLSAVQALQKTLRVEQLSERVAPVLADPSRLAEFCLPAESSAPPAGALSDPDQRGFVVSSINPNLRIVGTNLGTAELPTPGGPVSVQAITFFVNFGSSFVNVAHHAGRYFLRDGYHRAVGLLQAGITTVPCVVVEHGGDPARILPSDRSWPADVLLSERPPLLGHFLDRAVSDEVPQPATRKVVRIRGEEFVVQS